RNIFYSAAILRQLGWPTEAERLAAHRAAFVDLLRLPASALTVSTFVLEDDAVVGASALIDEVARAGFAEVPAEGDAVRIFEHEALGLEPLFAHRLAVGPRRWAERRLGIPAGDAGGFRGVTSGYRPRSFSLSGLERYQD